MYSKMYSSMTYDIRRFSFLCVHVKLEECQNVTTGTVPYSEYLGVYMTIPVDWLYVYTYISIWIMNMGEKGKYVLVPGGSGILASILVLLLQGSYVLTIPSKLKNDSKKKDRKKKEI